MKFAQNGDLVASCVAKFRALSRRRDEVLGIGASLLPAWEILIALAASSTDQSLDCVAASVDMSTATTRRWIGILEIRGLVRWRQQADMQTIELTSMAKEAIASIFAP